jgi:hypothetical protein
MSATFPKTVRSNQLEERSSKFFKTCYYRFFASLFCLRSFSPCYSLDLFERILSHLRSTPTSFVENDVSRSLFPAQKVAGSNQSEQKLEQEFFDNLEYSYYTVYEIDC